jgi:hypothetical protein
MRPAHTDNVRKHTSAARAFHTGLVADTHRLRLVLDKMRPHLDLLRRGTTSDADKLSAAEASCRHVVTLKKYSVAWRETYLDLHASLRRLRGHLKRFARLR